MLTFVLGFGWSVVLRVYSVLTRSVVLRVSSVLTRLARCFACVQCVEKDTGCVEKRAAYICRALKKCCLFV